MYIVLLQNALLSDSSSGEDDPTPRAEDVKSLLEIHNYQRGCRTQFYEDPEVRGGENIQVVSFKALYGLIQIDKLHPQIYDPGIQKAYT